MDNTFVQVILTILTVSVLWGAYELYRLRAETKLNYVLGRLENQIEINRAAPQLPEPQLFDQDADHA